MKWSEQKNSLFLFFSQNLFLYSAPELPGHTHSSVCAQAHACLCSYKCVRGGCPPAPQPHPKPTDFTDNKGDSRVIDTRAAKCCRDTK